MRQERIKRSLDWIERLIVRVEAVKAAPIKSLYCDKMTESALQIYRPLRHAARKAVEKPVQMQGNRAFCPDCGTGVSKKDNYCRICGQRLAARQQETPKPFYMVFDKEKYYGR